MLSVITTPLQVLPTMLVEPADILQCTMHAPVQDGVEFDVQVGWVLKGLVYAIIGGVACQASAQDKDKIKGADISPQARACVMLLPLHLACNWT